MANDNYTSIPNGIGQPANRNWSDHSDLSRNVLRAQGLIQFIQTFPVLLTNTIFNSIYAFGIFANIVLLVYLIYYKRYQMPVFCVILSLGVADLGVCVGSLLFYTLVFPVILGPLWLCNAIHALLFLCYLASIYHTTLFAVLRFIQLVYPLTSHSKLTTSLLLKICLTIWIAHSMQSFVIAVYYKGIDGSIIKDRPIYRCTFTGNRLYLHTWVIIVWFLVPFISTSGFHIAKQVSLVLWQSDATHSHTEGSQHVRKQTDSRALALVILTYLITVFPFIVQDICSNMRNLTHNPIDEFIINVFVQIAYTNSAINPWIYLFAAESVRADVRKMIRCTRYIRDWDSP